MIYIAAFAGFIKAFYDYAAAPADRAAQGGIYRLSRNPMYFFYFLGMAGVCVASASLWLLIVIVPFAIHIQSSRSPGREALLRASLRAGVSKV